MRSSTARRMNRPGSMFRLCDKVVSGASRSGIRALASRFAKKPSSVTEAGSGLNRCPEREQRFTSRFPQRGLIHMNSIPLIILAEDNATDVFLVRTALEAEGL